MRRASAVVDRSRAPLRLSWSDIQGACRNAGAADDPHLRLLADRCRRRAAAHDGSDRGPGAIGATPASLSWEEHCSGSRRFIRRMRPSRRRSKSRPHATSSSASYGLGSARRSPAGWPARPGPEAEPLLESGTVYEFENRPRRAPGQRSMPDIYVFRKRCLPSDRAALDQLDGKPSGREIAHPRLSNSPRQR